GVQGIPRIARDDPPSWRLCAQGVHVFRLAREQRYDRTVFEKAARIAFTHETREVGGKEDIEDGIRLCVGQGLHDATRVHLAERRSDLCDELDIGLTLLEKRLEALQGR